MIRVAAAAAAAARVPAPTTTAERSGKLPGCQWRSARLAPSAAPPMTSRRHGVSAVTALFGKAPPGVKAKKSVHEFTVDDADGASADLGAYRGTVLLIVNVASQCGLTLSNYGELAALRERHHARGFEVLAFPCNQFGGQEPGTAERVREYARARFGADFPVFAKVDVNGPRVAPLYAFLKASKNGGGMLGGAIKWNFSKFLVDKDGGVVARYAPTTSPSRIEKDIEKLL